MKLPSPSALLACIALATPLGAQAAMDSTTRTNFIKDCVAAANDQGLNDAAAKAHCECGANQIDSHFSQAEIAKLNNSDPAPDKDLTKKLKTLITDNCLQKKG